MSVHRVYRFLGALLFFVHVQGVAIPRPFLRPHLISFTNSDETVTMDQDIATFLKAVPCQIDLVVDFLYQDAARSFFPNTVASHGYPIYNSNIYLLSLINEQSLTTKMCKIGILKDLTSTKFCSDLAMEEYFENDFVSFLGELLKKMDFKDLVDVAKKIQSIKGEEECEKMCGGRYMSSLCRMFSVLSHFLVQELKAAVAKAKSPNPSAGSATEGDIFPEGPLNTSTDPPNSNQLSPNNPQQSPPAISSQPPSASLSTTAPPLIMKPALKDILLNSAFKNRLSPPSPTISPSSTSVDNKQGRHGNVQGGDQGPNQGESQPRSDGQSVPQGDVPVGANSYTYWSTSRPQGDDNPPQSELFDENGFLAENGMQNGADEEDLDATADMKKDEFENNYSDFTNEVNENPYQEKSDATGQNTFEGDGANGGIPGGGGPGDEANGGIPGGGEQGDGANGGMPGGGGQGDEAGGEQGDEAGGEQGDGANEGIPGVGGQGDEAGGEQGDGANGGIPGGGGQGDGANGGGQGDEAGGEQGDEANGGMPGGGGPGEQGGDNPKETQDVPQQQSVGEDNYGGADVTNDLSEADTDSNGYSSFHFFGIILVLAVFVVGTYLCIHNKKKIKDSMKDYVASDKQNRRSRRTRDYQPLLSGNK